MSVSTDSSTGVDNLLLEIARLRATNRKNQLRANRLRVSRDRWRDEARAWKWKALRAPLVSKARQPLTEQERMAAAG